MIVLGADLSLSRTGLVWLDEHFQLLRCKEMSFKPGLKRMLRIRRELGETIEGLMPDFCLIEDLAYGAPSRTVVLKLAELGAIMKLTLESHDIDYLLISPSAIKKQITGKGNSEKEIVSRELERLYQIKFANDKGFDLSDAAAAAVYGVQHLQQILPK